MMSTQLTLGQLVVALREATDQSFRCYDPINGDPLESEFRDLGYNYGQLFGQALEALEAIVQVDSQGHVFPPPKLIESMALRYDHADGIAQSFLAETDEQWKQRREYNRTVARQMWEEVVGAGFY